ncbi:hypothetical protein PHYBOEH_002316 [Phytophthora boehmeriae]|uniref:Calponin-homology (CH) domain-containing protein n=1 Tax=Phytophthora boehmeriae TaxID=109152 RepID=A0A8T1WSG4_9STRA|nr:hypothetical protein PHYBOEH_002316 [Phytophthora boehmeriae]
MAELLLRWINDDLQLSKHVTDVQVDFASGYLLGELLHRLNQQHNFSDFMRSSSADAKIINFCLLEPSLRNLNIKFDANVATAIMNEKKDAAANLLNQIKVI